MRHTKTVVDRPCDLEPTEWVIRIRKPVLSKATVRWAAALALSVGFNVGFISDALASPNSSADDLCLESAALHYEISGELDSAYEDALAACLHDSTYTGWIDEEPSDCERMAERAYREQGDSADAYEDTYAACVAMGVDLTEAYNAAGECETPTSWAERVGGDLWRPVCGDADGNEVGAP